MTYHNISANRAYDTIGLFATDNILYVFNTTKTLLYNETYVIIEKATGGHSVTHGATTNRILDREPDFSRARSTKNDGTRMDSAEKAHCVQVGKGMEGQEDRLGDIYRDDTQHLATTAKNGYALSPEGYRIDRAGKKPPGNAGNVVRGHTPISLAL